MEANAQALISRELGGDERLLWAGRPRQGIMFRRADVLMVPFSLMWGGFAFFWEYGVLSSGKAPTFFALWGIPFVLAGVYFIAGRFLVDAKQRENTVYGVTNERIVIVSGILSRRVKSLTLHTLSDVSLDQGADGAGTIAFGPGNPYSWWGAGMAWPGMPQPSPSFEQIPDSRSVYELIRKAQVVRHEA